MIDPRLRCHPLGFLQLLNPPSQEELSEYYAKIYYQTEQASYRHTYPPLELEVIGLRIKHRVEQALSLRDSNQPGRFLDVGCGEGFLLAALSEMGWDVLGIDFSVAGVQAMNPQMAKYVSQGDVFELLNTLISVGEAYDLVWLGNVLEHVLDPVALLRSLRQIVSDDGVLIVVVPNDGNAYHENLFEEGLIDRRWWIAIPDHISYFTKESLINTAIATDWLCPKIQGDFPIDLFLSHPGSNYVNDPSKGSDAHKARLRLEKLIFQAGDEAVNQFYTALAGVGLGRDLIAFLKPKN
jgi:2-polyprenyl-3-methyl-5-hydroxy-6-metoxy-1,4-benzoquinol methylase